MHPLVRSRSTGRTRSHMASHPRRSLSPRGIRRRWVPDGKGFEHPGAARTRGPLRRRLPCPRGSGFDRARDPDPELHGRRLRGRPVLRDFGLRHGLCVGAAVRHLRSALPFLAKRVARIVPLYWLITALFALYVAHDPAEPMSRHAFVRFLGTSLLFVPYLAPANPDSFPSIRSAGRSITRCSSTSASPRRWRYRAGCGHGARLRIRRLRDARRDPHAARSVRLSRGHPDPRIRRRHGDRGTRPGGSPGAEAGGARGHRGRGRVRTFHRAEPRRVVGLARVRLGVARSRDRRAAALCPALRDGGPIRRGFERLGDASYALYLVHYGCSWPSRRSSAPGAARSDAGIAVHGDHDRGALRVAFAVHRLVEVPLTRALQRRVLPRGVAPSPCRPGPDVSAAGGGFA